MTYLNRSKSKLRRTTRSQVSQPMGQLLASRKLSYLTVGHYQIKGFKDQNGGKWLLIHRGENTATVRYEVGSEGSIWGRLDKSDIVISSSTTKNAILKAIESIPDWPIEVYSVTTPGFHRNAFVKPDATVIGEPSAKRFVINLEKPVTLSKAGSGKLWRSLVATHVQGQPVLVLALCTAFVGPLLGLFGGANVCVELVAPTSTGKTTALDLYASVWGAPHSERGSIGISLRATANSIEQHVLARGSAALPADEVSQLGSSSRQQAASLFEIAFMMAEGVGKDRWNDWAAPRARLSSLITSNTPIETLLQGADPEQLKAILVRVISVRADAGPGKGVLDSLPKGFAHRGVAIKALKAGLAANHGHAADAFLERLVREVKRDEARLKSKIERSMARFMEAADVAPDDHAAWRRAQSVAIIFAAGRLAADWGVIPIKGIKAALVECYRRSTPTSPTSSASPLNAHVRVHDYVRANKAELEDLDQADLRNRRRVQLDSMPGFLKTIRGRRCLLVRAKRWEAEFGSDARAMLQELRRNGLLVAQKGFQEQTRIRKNRPKDRVYAIVLDRVDENFS